MTFRSWCAAAVLSTLAFASVDHAFAIDPLNNRNTGSSSTAALDPFSTNPSGSAAGTSIPVLPISTGAIPTGPSSVNPAFVTPSFITSPVPPIGTIDPGRTRIAPGTQAPIPGTPGTIANPLIQPQPGTPTPTLRNRWRLGVYSTDTDAGVKIVEVVPNSPAFRAGLEPNDSIVTVNGFQVGFVGTSHFDTGSEFDRLADDNGNVILLVRNQRDGSLVNVPLQLDSRFSSLNGTIGYRERAQLPQDAVCTVELREVSRPNAPPIALSSKVIAIRQIPIPFRLEYDPADIVARRNYFVHATITSGNRQLFTTTQSYPVLSNGTTGTNQTVAITVDPVVVAAGTQVTSRDQQLDEILRLYQSYLQRDPRQNEYEVLSSRMERGQSIRDVQLDLLSGNKYYFRCEADNRNFVNQLHQEFLHRTAQPAEMEYWLTRMDQYGGLRREVAREFLQAVGAPQS